MEGHKSALATNLLTLFPCTHLAPGANRACVSLSGASGASRALVGQLLRELPARRTHIRRACQSVILVYLSRLARVPEHSSPTRLWTAPPLDLVRQTTPKSLVRLHVQQPHLQQCPPGGKRAHWHKQTICTLTIANSLGRRNPLRLLCTEINSARLCHVHPSCLQTLSPENHSLVPCDKYTVWPHLRFNDTQAPTPVLLRSAKEQRGGAPIVTSTKDMLSPLKLMNIGGRAVVPTKGRFNCLQNRIARVME